MVAKGEKSDLPQSFANVPRKGPGRPRTPQLFLEWSDAAAALVVACASGKVPLGFEDIPSIKDMADGSPRNLRIDAAKHILDRRYGKPREHVDVDDQRTVDRVLRVIVESETPKPVIDAVPKLEVKRPLSS